MGQALSFFATCPTCGRDELQDAFTCAALERLIDGCYPIEAYCTLCTEFWTVNIQKRVEIIEAVSQSIRRRFLVVDNTSSAGDAAIAAPDGLRELAVANELVEPRGLQTDSGQHLGKTKD